MIKDFLSKPIGDVIDSDKLPVKITPRLPKPVDPNKLTLRKTAKTDPLNVPYHILKTFADVVSFPVRPRITKEQLPSLEERAQKRPSMKQLVDQKATISQRKDKKSFFDFLPEDVKRGLFGETITGGQGETIERTGLINTLFPGIAVSEFQKFENRKRALMDKGVSFEEAEEKAYGLTNYGRGNLTAFEKSIKRNPEIRKQYEALPPEEKKAVRGVAVFEGINKALDAINFTGIGSIGGKTVAKIIAETGDKELIRKTIMKEIPELTDAEGETFANFFRVMNSEKEVETVLNRIKFQAKKKASTPKSAEINFLQKPLEDVVDVKPAQPIKNFLSQPIRSVLENSPSPLSPTARGITETTPPEELVTPPVGQGSDEVAQQSQIDKTDTAPAIRPEDLSPADQKALEGVLKDTTNETDKLIDEQEALDLERREDIKISMSKANKEKYLDAVSDPQKAVKTLAEKMNKRDMTTQEMDEAYTSTAILEDVIEQTAASKLRKYVSKATGRLPEVTGKETIQAISGSGKEVKNSEFGRRGDEIVADLGFPNLEAATKALDDYIETKERLTFFREKLKTLRRDKRMIRQGENLMRIALSDRRARFKALKGRYNLTDADVSDIRDGRDISIMTDQEFNDFLTKSEDRAVDLTEKRKARIQVEGTIEEKHLKKTENLQKALKLPPLDEMTTEQLYEFDKILTEYQFEDEFLGQRKLETLDKTDLKGVRTYREARERLAKKLGMSLSEVSNLKVWERDRFLWDTALAERNPFYNLFVEGFNASMLEGEMRYLELEKRTEELMKSARGKGNVIDKLVPTDNNIFSYLEASPAEKQELAKRMKPGEYQAAEYFREEFRKALDYEYKNQVIRKSRFEDSYVTHIRRNFLEAIKSELQQGSKTYKALWIGVKEWFDKYKDDFAVLNILDQKTGQILPLEKFFKFAMARSGNMVPSKNVAKAFLSYMKIFETKRALDKIIPEIMTYADVLTPQEFTPHGLLKDDRLSTFIKTYLNNKKGRRVDFGFPTGGKIDGVFKAAKGLTSLLDLGLNFITQIASHGGAQTGVMTTVGFKKFGKAWAKEFSPKYRALANKYESYTGLPPWKDVISSKFNASEKTKNLLFYIFKSANYWAKKIHFLSSVTPEEVASGTVSPQRLAQMNLELGRWLPIEKAESIMGSTTGGSILTQYRKWAIVAARTAIKNLKEVTKGVGKEGLTALKKKEAYELYRIATITGTVAIISFYLSLDEDQKNDTFVDRLTRKMLQDSMSLLSASDPKTWESPPRLLSFLTDILHGLSDLVRGVEYKTSGENYKKGDLKAPKEFKRIFTPAIVRNLKTVFNNQKSSSESSLKIKGDLPKLPKLPKMKKITAELPPMPKLPKLPKLKKKISI